MAMEETENALVVQQVSEVCSCWCTYRVLLNSVAEFRRITRLTTVVSILAVVLHAGAP